MNQLYRNVVTPLAAAIAFSVLIDASSTFAAAKVAMGSASSATARARSAVASLTSSLSSARSLMFAANMAINGSAGQENYFVHGQVQRPNKMLVTVEKAGSPVAVAVSDGTDLTIYSGSTGHFVKIAVPATGIKTDDPTVLHFLGDEMGRTVSQALLSTAETFLKPGLDLSRLIPPSSSVSQKVSATVLNTQSGGKPVAVVTQRLTLSSARAPGSSFQIVMGLVIDKATLTPRTMSLSTSKDGQPLVQDSRIEFSNFELSNTQLADASFAFTLPTTAVAYVAPPQAPDTSGALVSGTTAPDFTVQTIGGKPVKLSDYAGKVVVLDLWATWCGPCQMSLPHTARLASAYHEKGVVFMPVCVSDTQEDFDNWLPQHKNLTMNFLFDPAGRSGSSFSNALYHVNSIPTQFVIGKNRVIVATFVGYDSEGDPTETQLAKAIDTALATK